VTSSLLPPAWKALKDRFLQSEDLVLGDENHVSPEEMWEYACLPFQGIYRHALDHRIDTELLSILRHKYLAFSCEKRVKNMQKTGRPIIFAGDMIAGFPSMELIHGCHGAMCSATIAINEIIWNGTRDTMEEAAQWCSFEACPGEPAMLLMARDGKIPTDMIINLMGEGCCATQMFRKWPIPLKFIDVPFNGKGKKWALEYLTGQIKATVDWIFELSGKKATIEDLNNGIRVMNDAMETCRELVELTTSAEVPPIAGAESLFAGNCMYDCCGDPKALIHANRSLIKELEQRVGDNYRPAGIAKDPIRIYMCSTMITNQEIALLEDLGGVVMGPNSFDSRVLFHQPMRSNTNDPCKEMADWSLNHSPWSVALSLEERTRWIFKVIEKYRPEGVIFSAVWGCPIGPQFSRYMADQIKERLNIPWISLEHDFNSMQIDNNGKFALSASQRTRLEGFMEMLRVRRKKKRLPK
jgi:benzoyl-CoA reductase/2-hydroxyglutaryl-CoA dehydratase subunit BcrC/BadD/HgdB